MNDFLVSLARRKQGGSQSVNDNAKGPAKSAGALLRRYGEQALREVRLQGRSTHSRAPVLTALVPQDIRGLLLEWREEIDASERVFIRANTSNRRIFLDFDESPIPKGEWAYAALGPVPHRELSHRRR